MRKPLLHPLFLLALALTGLPLLAGGPVNAQLSPNCRRNGQPAACALTPGEESPERSVLTVVFADHSAWRLEKRESLCEHNHPLITCPALLTPANGNGTPLSGEYRGTWYEGGYRHEWSAPGIRIEYVYLD